MARRVAMTAFLASGNGAKARRRFACKLASSGEFRILMLPLTVIERHVAELAADRADRAQDLIQSTG
jgi:hypothetical protein